MTNKLNIVIPMAGAGSRFSKVGYKNPKPFIDVKGKMMIERVLDNLKYNGAKFILIARKEHIENYPAFVKKIKDNYDVEFLTVDRLTDGAACTCLKAHKIINNDIPLLFANSDQIVDMDIADYIDDCLNKKLDGSILTFLADHPKWSYARLNDDGFVSEVKEKEVISNNATVGLYFYTKGKYFVDATLDMIANADKSKNEYYVAPTYNYCVKDGMKINIYNIEEGQMHGIGTPDDLNNYLKLI